MGGGLVMVLVFFGFFFFLGEQLMGSECFFVALGRSGIFSGVWVWRFDRLRTRISE